MHIEEPVDYFEIMFNPPVRTTSSPPVPAVAKVIWKFRFHRGGVIIFHLNCKSCNYFITILACD
jgi:hypothetical protein